MQCSAVQCSAVPCWAVQCSECPLFAAWQLTDQLVTATKCTISNNMLCRTMWRVSALRVYYEQSRQPITPLPQLSDRQLRQYTPWVLQASPSPDNTPTPHFVTWRGNLTKLLTTPYCQNDVWAIGVTMALRSYAVVLMYIAGGA